MISTVDRAVTRGVAGADSRVLDRVMPGLSRLADYGVLFATGAALEKPGLAAARSRLFAAVDAGTLGRCRVYQAWRAPSAEISSADGSPVWLSVDGEAATAEPGFRIGKRPHGLLVYRKAGTPAGGMPPAAPGWLRRRARDDQTARGSYPIG
jgi:hypothetical protein